MPSPAPFTPGESKAITVAATSARVALPTPTGNQVVVTSVADNDVAYIAFGGSSVTVAIPTGTEQNGFPILAGTPQTFTIGPAVTHIATIGTASDVLYVSVGDGQ